MSTAILTHRVTAAEYLTNEATAAQRHEIHLGQVLLTSGGPDAHGILVSALGGLLFAALRGKICRYLNSEIKVEVLATGSYYYPDVTIACPPNFVNRSAGVIDNPKVIFEVLSPSTEAFDRGAKFRAYEQIPTLNEYVLVDSESVFVEMYTRQTDETWRRTTYAGPAAILKLSSVAVSLSLGELHEDVLSLLVASYPSPTVLEALPRRTTVEL